LEAGAKGEVAAFDLFSCYVAKGIAPPPQGKLNPAHVMTHLATNLVAAGGAAVSVHGIDVPIYIIPSAPKRPGSFQVKNVDPDVKKALDATVTCLGNPVTCKDPPALHQLLR
jgi:hypothetical protein